MSDQLVYLGNVYEADQFERQFNPRLQVDNADDVLPRRRKLSEETRAALPHVLDVAYGSREREIVDIFPADGPDAPALIYFHGGYWCQGHARENNYVAKTFAGAGTAVFVATYDLCPAVSIGHIVDQARAAVAWVHAHAAEYGADPSNLYLCGHSAGAHLAALCLTEPIADVPATAIRGACLVSGIYDLEPVRAISINDDVNIDTKDLIPLSPLNQPPTTRTPMLIACGEAESAEWQRQSRLYASVCQSAGATVEELTVPGADHYSIMFDVMDPSQPLSRAMLAMMGLR